MSCKLCYKINLIHYHTEGKCITQLKIVANAIQVVSKSYLPISLLPPMKIQEILNEVNKTI